MRPTRRFVPSEAFQAAVLLHQEGRLQDAARLYREVLRAEPDHFESLHHLGVVKAQQGKLDEGIRLMRRALSKHPQSVETLSDLGVALEGAKRHAEAIPCYEKALALKPDYAEASFNLGNALQALGRHEEAIGRFENAISLKRDHAEAHNNLGSSLHALGRHEEAIPHFERALAMHPYFADAENNFATALQALGRHREAIAHFTRAIALKPDHARAYSNLGNSLHELGRHEEALAHLERALAIEPDNADACNNLGNALSSLRRYDGAIASYRRAVRLDPLQGNALSSYVTLKRRICDWSDFAEDGARLIGALGSGARLVSPFVLTAVTDDPGDQLRGAKQYVEDLRLDRLHSAFDRTFSPREKIRLAYLSADLREHAVAHLIAELIERHDRARFDVLALCWAADDGSDIRRRLERSFDRFIDIRRNSDADVARQMRMLEIDIAVDLMGFTRDCRPGILAHRPAPVQVNYLGYPATMGAAFIDYAIVDPFVVPPEEQPYFTERLVHLPDCYQVNDAKRIIAKHAPSRAECGLPQEAFVFACFNNTYKISPRFFDVWMRLLQAVPGSVLWMLGDNQWAMANLRHEAASRGVAPNRLVFAPRCSSVEHLARHRLADLFLDTLPYNAHVTASDALWAGLPVLTCTGRAFASRVAGSLLRALGVAELVTTSPEEYEALALRLARDPQLLADIRDRMAKNRATAPLFDSDRFRRHLEFAYQEMRARRQRGEPPQSFAVPSISP
jgi:protein O-GlcNAc transferase